MVTVNYNQRIQGKNATLFLNTNASSSPLFFATPGSSSNFLVDPNNNLAAEYYDQSVYDRVKAFYMLALVIAVLGLVGFLLGLFTSKFIGVEMVGVVQVAFVGLASINNIHPLLAPLAQIGFVNGLNSLFTNQQQSQLSGNVPIRASALEYDSQMIYSMNYMVAVMLLPLLVSLVAYIMSAATKSEQNKLKYKGWCLTALCEFGLAVVAFVLYHQMMSVLFFAVYASSTAQLFMPSVV